MLERRIAPPAEQPTPKPRLIYDFSKQLDTPPVLRMMYVPIPISPAPDIFTKKDKKDDKKKKK